MTKSLTGFEYTQKHYGLLPLPTEAQLDAIRDDARYLWDLELWDEIVVSASIHLHSLPDEERWFATLEYIAHCIEGLRPYGECPVAPDYSDLVEWLEADHD